LLCLTVGAVAGVVLLLHSDSRAAAPGFGESASSGGSQASTGKSVTPIPNFHHSRPENSWDAGACLSRDAKSG
jgi:hypothetical protein